MNIQRIGNSTNFGDCIPLCMAPELAKHPLVRGSVKAIRQASKVGKNQIVSLWNEGKFDGINTIRVSASTAIPGAKIAKIDFYVPATRENVKNKTLLKVVKEAVKLVTAK